MQTSKPERDAGGQEVCIRVSMGLRDKSRWALLFFMFASIGP